MPLVLTCSNSVLESFFLLVEYQADLEVKHSSYTTYLIEPESWDVHSKNGVIGSHRNAVNLQNHWKPVIFSEFETLWSAATDSYLYKNLFMLDTF